MAFILRPPQQNAGNEPRGQKQSAQARRRAPGDRLLPRPLFIGAALIALGVALSLFNNAPRSTHVPAPVAHGPVATVTQTLDGVRVRPEIVSPSAVRGTTELLMSFHDDAAIARVIDPADMTLLPARIAPASYSLQGRLRRTQVAPGRFVTGTLVFARPLTPGATLVWTPTWSDGRTLRWLLYH